MLLTQRDAEHHANPHALSHTVRPSLCLHVEQRPLLCRVFFPPGVSLAVL